MFCCGREGAGKTFKSERRWRAGGVGPSIRRTGRVGSPPQTRFSKILSEADGKEELTRMEEKVN